MYRNIITINIYTLIISLFIFSCAPKSSLNTHGDIFLNSSNEVKRNIVFIHGYGGSKCSWSLISDKLPKNYNATYIELLGFGNSIPPDNFDYKIESQSRFISEIYRDKFDSDTIFVAHSYGAAVLLVAMVDFNVNPKKVILIDPLAYKQNLPFFIKAQTIPILSDIIYHIINPSIKVDIVLNKIYHDKNQIDDKIRRCYISEFKIPFHNEALHKTSNNINNIDYNNYISKYQYIDSEFHIIWGENDPILDVSFSETLRNDISAKTISIIPNCGHAPHEECPDELIYYLIKGVEYE